MENRLQSKNMKAFLRRSLVFVIVFFCWSGIVFSQVDIGSVEDNLNDVYGIEKLENLIVVLNYYKDIHLRKALKYARQAVDISDNLFPEDSLTPPDTNFYLKAEAYNLLALAHFNKEHYYDAMVNFKKAREYSNQCQYVSGFFFAESYLLKLDSIGVKTNFFKQTLNDLNLGKTINDGSDDLAISIAINNAESAEKNENYEKAIRNYEKAINYLMDQGDEERIAELHHKIGDNYKNLGNIPKSFEYYNMAIGELEELGDTTGVTASKAGVKDLHDQIDLLVENYGEEDDSLFMPVVVQSEPEFSMDEYIDKAIASEANEDYEKSLKYFKMYTQLNNEMLEAEKNQEMALLEKGYQIERNLQKIQLLTQEKEIQELELQNNEADMAQQEKFRTNLLVGLSLLLALAIALYFLYSTKKRDHKKLNIAHLELKSTQSKLISAEKKIKTLLGQQLSDEVAKELMLDNVDGSVQKKLVCIMFLDIRGFTSFAENKKPEEIIDYQNKVFGFMIDSVYKHHGIINQFLGDGFMATFGAPHSAGNDSENALKAAMEIVLAVNQKSKNGDIPKTRVGVGLHTGNVVVGNVGTSLRKQYSITGNAVIIASRIEQLNKTYTSQFLISEDVLNAVDKTGLKHEVLGEVQLKGRGKPIGIIKIM